MSALLLVILVATATKPAFAVTWSINITRITTEPVFDGLPSITQTSDGKIWIVWVKAVYGDNTLFYKTSSNLGTTWSEEKNLTYIFDEMLGRHDTHPSIIQAKNGTVWLVWASNKPPAPTPDFSIGASPKNLTIQQGDSNSSTITITSLCGFSEPVDLSVKNAPIDITTNLNPSQVTPQPNDTANSTLTVSVEPTAIPRNYTLTVIGKSGALSHNLQIGLEITQSGTASLGDASLSSFPASSTESATEYEMDYEIFYKTSNDNGATWSSRHQLTSNALEDLCPSIVQLKNGTIMVAHQSGEAYNPNIFYNATLDGTSWTYGTIVSSGWNDKDPTLMQAKDGRIWVAWTSIRNGDYEIFFKTYNGSSWSTDTRLTYSENEDITPSILQTIDGIIWIFWSSRGTATSATTDIYYKFRSENNATWSGSIQFTTEQYEDTWPALAQTSDTAIWVVWASDRADQPDGNWDIYCRKSLAGDVNGDGTVDDDDLLIIGSAYGYFIGQPGHNPDADFNKDGYVDNKDLHIIGRNYGST